MADLDDLVPEQNRGGDEAAVLVKGALSMFPVVGSFAAEGLTYFLDRRDAKKQREFNLAVVENLNRLKEQVKKSLTLEQVVDSDEFCAAVTRAQRLAAETGSEERRRWLASAVANSGSWSDFNDTERQQFSRLTEDLDPLHVWLLHYFQDPMGWLQAHELKTNHSTISASLASALNASWAAWNEPVRLALADLERSGLTSSVPLDMGMSARGVFEQRTLDKGTRFLKFINEPDSAEREAPQLS